MKQYGDAEFDNKGGDISGPIDYSILGTFFKYCSDNEKVIGDLFKNHKIRFTQPAALNDPLEFQPTLTFNNDSDNYRYELDGDLLMSKKDFYWAHTILYRIDKFGILSLTKVPDSFDMWSQYSNGHRGFLLGFKHDFNKRPCMLSKVGKEYPIKQVNYVDDYSINMDEFIDQDGKLYLEIDEKLFFNKVSRWRYEEEYRIVRPLSDSDHKELPYKPRERDTEGRYLFDFSLDCIESITFGAYMAIEKKKEIMSTCEGSSISFFQAIIVRDERDRWGKPCSVKIIPIEIFPDFMNMVHFICDNIEIEGRQNRIKIQKLDELPFYKIDPKWFQQFYENRKARLRKQKHRPDLNVP